MSVPKDTRSAAEKKAAALLLKAHAQLNPGDGDDVISIHDGDEQIAQLKELLQQSQQETKEMKKLFRELQAQQSQGEVEEKQVEPAVTAQQIALIQAIIQQQKSEIRQPIKLPAVLPSILKVQRSRKINYIRKLDI